MTPTNYNPRESLRLKQGANPRHSHIKLKTSLPLFPHFFDIGVTHGYLKKGYQFQKFVFRGLWNFSQSKSVKALIYHTFNRIVFFCIILNGYQYFNIVNSLQQAPLFYTVGIFCCMYNFFYKLIFFLTLTGYR